MKSIVVHGAGDLRIEERAAPTPDEGEVLVAMEWGGICGSDIAYWRRGASGTATLKHPLVLGHEVSGRVVEVGAAVTNVHIGQTVTVHPARIVGREQLPEHIAGRANLHAQVRYLGSAAQDPHTDGGFSESLVLPASQLRPLPEGVSAEHGALAEPLAVALHAAQRAGDLTGRTVLINGTGPIGALVVAAAKHRGAEGVVGADLRSDSLAIAGAMGADQTVDVSSERLPEDVEVVFEVSGAPAALGSVLRATARGGTLVQVGNLPGTAAPAALGDLVTREITWLGSYRFVEEIGDALAVMAAGLDVSPIVTHRFELDDAARALEIAADPTSGSSKVLLRLG